MIKTGRILEKSNFKTHYTGTMFSALKPVPHDLGNLLLQRLMMGDWFWYLHREYDVCRNNKSQYSKYFEILHTNMYLHVIDMGLPVQPCHIEIANKKSFEVLVDFKLSVPSHIVIVCGYL